MVGQSADRRLSLRRFVIAPAIYRQTPGAMTIEDRLLITAPSLDSRLSIAAVPCRASRRIAPVHMSGAVARSVIRSVIASSRADHDVVPHGWCIENHRNYLVAVSIFRPTPSRRQQLPAAARAVIPDQTRRPTLSTPSRRGRRPVAAGSSSATAQRGSRDWSVCARRDFSIAGHRIILSLMLFVSSGRSVIPYFVTQQSTVEKASASRIRHAISGWQQMSIKSCG